MNKILLLCCLFLVVSCAIDYDGETRLVLKSKISSIDGVAIPNQKVKIYVNDNSHTDLVSEGATDQSGNLTLIFTAPTLNRATIDIEVLSESPYTYLNKKFIGLKKEDFNNFEYKLITNIYKPENFTNFEVTLNRISTDKEIKNIVLEGELPDEKVYFNQEPQDLPYIQTNFRVLKNKDYVLKYSIFTITSGLPIKEDFTTSISVGNNPATYSITY